MLDDPQVLTPLIHQRADPHLTRHVHVGSGGAGDGPGDGLSRGRYFFTGSVPEFDRIELRASELWQDLARAEPRVIWRKPDSGRWSELIWAPKLHFRQGAWYVYFAAAPSREAVDGLFQHRMYALRNASPDPMTGEWEFLGQIDTGRDTCCLDATTFEHRGQLYFLWAQKDHAIAGHANLYIAPMRTPWQLDGAAVMLSRPEHDWECRGFQANQAPSVLQRGGKVFISYSAGAKDPHHAMGLLWMDDAADPLDPASWTKSPVPVLTTSRTQPVFGPGHNSFALDEDDRSVLLVYHARTYTKIVGDPLWNPDRHTFVKRLRWGPDGMPRFGDAGLD